MGKEKECQKCGEPITGPGPVCAHCEMSDVYVKRPFDYIRNIHQATKSDCGFTKNKHQMRAFGDAAIYRFPWRNCTECGQRYKPDCSRPLCPACAEKKRKNRKIEHVKGMIFPTLRIPSDSNIKAGQYGVKRVTMGRFLEITKDGGWEEVYSGTNSQFKFYHVYKNKKNQYIIKMLKPRKKEDDYFVSEALA